ncbi:hypothetical protein BDD14_2653 [Edaphobacter modestus]|uniref:Uncharacterized protein n=1 Tax=Edaphobacter modestus TaxID=388466 RepID=A0A4Q7YTK6_9BACT|nr:hypothetical protein BDD14_2653 [Edaphobacter modestus]
MISSIGRVCASTLSSVSQRKSPVLQAETTILIVSGIRSPVVDCLRSYSEGELQER